MTAVSVGDSSPPAARLWWVLLVSGILWIFIGLFVLEANYDSAQLIGYLVAFWLIFAGIAEFVALAAPVGWKWMHAVLGILFLAGGLAALTEPLQTFTLLAGLLAFFLVLKGTFDIVIALFERHDNDLWWLTFLAGIFELLLGFWAAGYPGRSAALLLIWIGFGALIRGIVEIVTAFQIRKLGHELEVAA